MVDDIGFSKGLAGVVADTTAISRVIGEEGRLIYRGIPIETLAEKSSFEECVYFALYGKLPTQNELEQLIIKMKSYRVLPKSAELIIQQAACREAHPMAVLQAVIAALGFTESAVDLKNEAANIETAIALISRTATAVAMISRDRRGLSPVPACSNLSHAANFLYMIQGEKPSQEMARMFDVALILHLDHDFNASTFAARVVASTEAKLSLAISAAVGALSGPLHGGANERVLEMVDSIGSQDKAKAWVEHALATKAKVMGFGHRVYRTMDPRAKVLRAMLEKAVVSQPEKQSTYQILLTVHDTMIEALSKNSKDYIWPNVDFWSGALYRLMGLESIDFTPVFAVSRVAGWSSHIIEMWRDNRIYRPAAKYVGPVDAGYVAIENR